MAAKYLFNIDRWYLCIEFENKIFLVLEFLEGWSIGQNSPVSGKNEKKERKLTDKPNDYAQLRIHPQKYIEVFI